MAYVSSRRMFLPPRPILVYLALVSPLLFPTHLVHAVRSFPGKFSNKNNGDLQMGIISKGLSARFNEAPEFRNGVGCPLLPASNDPSSSSAPDPFRVHIAMTLDKEYLRGSISAIHSVLKHASCPQNVYFHFIASSSSSGSDPYLQPVDLVQIVQSTFPSLAFKVYPFDENLVNKLISSSIRLALEQPLNYARSYLARILDPSVTRVIYLDSDLIVVDDIQRLWYTPLTGSRVIGSPEYCHVNFTKYFTDQFWADPNLRKVFEGKRPPCYFNTGVMIMDLKRWREGEYTEEIEKWMEIKREKRIYELGSLPPFLLVFGGELVQGIDHRWNQHGLGGDNVMDSCRPLHGGPVSLLHWSGKGKPWARLDAGRPCPVDHLWALYDLRRV